MKQAILFVLTVAALTANAQDKTNYTAYNKLITLEGTNYVIATVETRSKLSTENSYYLFINTTTGESNQLNFPKDAYIRQVKQVKIDSLHINKVLFSGNTVNLDGNKTIDWNDPTQVIVCSTDGKEKIQITEDKFFVSTWTVNNQTGIIVITGHYDSNNNGKYDKTDKNEILLYDLAKMALVKRI